MICRLANGRALMQLKKHLDDSELWVETRDQVVVLRINRPQKRNAINDTLMERLGAFFQGPPAGIRAVVLTGAGENFSSGLDLAEHRERDARAVMLHSQMWHRVLDSMESSGLPVVSVLKGAVIGGGLEIATATHVRVAEQGTFYALPEAIRGIYVGGGASVRIAGLIGRGRMIEMMLTGRTFSTEEGQSLGISHYIVDRGKGEQFAIELARKIARNAPLSNYAILNAIPRIAEMSPRAGLFAESLMAAVVHTADEAKAGLSEFLDKKAPRLRDALESGAPAQSSTGDDDHA
jgi:(methylthio)acryloyl-CoA hydratase